MSTNDFEKLLEEVRTLRNEIDYRQSGCYSSWDMTDNDQGAYDAYGNCLEEIDELLKRWTHESIRTIRKCSSFISL